MEDRLLDISALHVGDVVIYYDGYYWICTVKEITDDAILLLHSAGGRDSGFGYHSLGDPDPRLMQVGTFYTCGQDIVRKVVFRDTPMDYIRVTLLKQ
jgi:hypothetical protein